MYRKVTVHKIAYLRIYKTLTHEKFYFSNALKLVRYTQQVVFFGFS